MAFIPWPHGAKAVFKWHFGTTTWNNIWAFSKVNFTYPDMVTLSTVLETAIYTAFKNHLSINTWFDGVDVIDMREEGAAEYHTPYGGTHGNQDDDIQSFADAICVTLRTAKRGRAFRGRLYLAGFTQSTMLSGFWLQATATEAENQVIAWASAALLSGWVHCVASEQFNHVPRTLAELNPVTGWEVRSLAPGHQRRRDRRP